MQSPPTRGDCSHDYEISSHSEARQPPLTRRVNPIKTWTTHDEYCHAQAMLGMLWVGYSNVLELQWQWHRPRGRRRDLHGALQALHWNGERGMPRMSRCRICALEGNSCFGSLTSSLSGIRIDRHEPIGSGLGCVIAPQPRSDPDGETSRMARPEGINNYHHRPDRFPERWRASGRPPG